MPARRWSVQLEPTNAMQKSLPRIDRIGRTTERPRSLLEQCCGVHSARPWTIKAQVSIEDAARSGSNRGQTLLPDWPGPLQEQALSPCTALAPCACDSGVRIVTTPGIMERMVLTMSKRLQAVLRRRPCIVARHASAQGKASAAQGTAPVWGMASICATQGIDAGHGPGEKHASTKGMASVQAMHLSIDRVARQIRHRRSPKEGALASPGPAL